MLTKEYRICMPLSVEEYRVGQLYTICKHSDAESRGSEGVQVITNQPHSHPQHGAGQYTEKHIYLSSKLPHWARAFVPNIFYITERAWNYYPYTLTEYTCSLMSRFSIRIETRFLNDNGTQENVFSGDPLPPEDVCFVDILSDPFPEAYYKPSEDPATFCSQKTNRGPLKEDWLQTARPIMCSYKRVTVSFEMYGVQSRVEQMIHKKVRDLLLVAHREAYVWVDQWIDMSVEEVRCFERELQTKTNQRMASATSPTAMTETDTAQESRERGRPSLSRSISLTDTIGREGAGEWESDAGSLRKSTSMKDRSHVYQ